MEIDDRAVAEAIHDSGVRRLQYAYADVVNRRAWPELDRLFLADATVVIDRRAGEPLRLTGGAELGTFIGTSIEPFEFFEFVILNAHIHFPEGADGGTALARMFMSELRQHRASGHWTTVFGLYHDRYLLREGQWWFAEWQYHSLAREGPDLDTFALPEHPGIEVPGVRP